MNFIKIKTLTTIFLFLLFISSYAEEYTIETESFGVITIDLDEDVEIEENGKNDLSATYKFAYENSTLLVTFIFGPNVSDKFSDESMYNFVENSGKKVMSSAVEDKLVILEEKMDQGSMYFFSVTDKNPKPNEFKYLTQGTIRFGDIGATFTILHNDESKEQNSFWLEAVKSLKQSIEKEELGYFGNLKLTAKDIKNIAAFDDELHLLSIQTTIFYKNPETYEGIFPDCVAKEYQSVKVDNEKGSVLFMKFDSSIEGELEFLKSLLYGASQKPSNHHPEILEAEDDILIIYSFEYESDICEKIIDIISSRL
jgi:hypothetical protein